MADENNNDLTPKRKVRLPQVDMSGVKRRASIVGNLIKKFIILIAIVAAAGSGFFLGARMHELGALEGVMGKTLKGATVTISGSCMSGDEMRDPALAEDEVIVTNVDGEKLAGVVRKTREKIECEIKDIAIEKLPLLANIGKSPVAVPDIAAMEKKVAVPTYKLLENKILLVSGTCQRQSDRAAVDPFTDERLDVTSVESNKENPDVFFISGIRRSDKLAIVCSSKSIRYTITDGSEPIVAEKPKEPLTFINKVVLVTSKCVPDPRVRTPRGPDGRKVAFYRLANSEVQVIEETIRNEKLVRFTGSILDRKSDGFGQMIVCDQQSFPFTAPLKGDDEDVLLERPDSQVNKKDATNKTQTETEDEEVVAPAATGKKAVAKPAAKKAVEKKAESAPMQEATEMLAPTQESAPATEDAQKEDLLKQLDGGTENGGQ